MSKLKETLYQRTQNPYPSISQPSFLSSSPSTLSSLSSYAYTLPPPMTSSSKRDSSKQTQFLGLHSAAATGNLGLVKFALDHGAPIDSVMNGFLPLQMACISDNNLAVVQYLVDRGADVNARRWPRRQSQSSDKALVAAGATGSTALHVAAANGCTKTVELLLRNGARVNLKDKYGSTPVTVALAKNHGEIANILETFQAFQEEMDAELLNNGSQEDVTSGATTPTDEMPPFRQRRPSLPSIFEAQQQQQQQQQQQMAPPRRSLNLPRSQAAFIQSHAEHLPFMPAIPIHRSKPSSVYMPSNTPPNFASPRASIEPNFASPRASMDSVYRLSPGLSTTPELSSSRSSDESGTEYVPNASARSTPPVPPVPSVKTTTLLSGYSISPQSHLPASVIDRRPSARTPTPTYERSNPMEAYRVPGASHSAYDLSVNDKKKKRRSTDPSKSNRSSRNSIDLLRAMDTNQSDLGLQRSASDGGKIRDDGSIASSPSSDNVMFGTGVENMGGSSVDEAMPRHSMATTDGSETYYNSRQQQQHQRENKKAWWPLGRKSMDAASYARASMEGGSPNFPRMSIDSRPRMSIDGRPRLSIDGRPRLSTDGRPRMSIDSFSFSRKSIDGLREAGSVTGEGSAKDSDDNDSGSDVARTKSRSNSIITRLVDVFARRQ